MEHGRPVGRCHELEQSRGVVHPEGALADKWAIELPREGRGCECGAAALRPSDEHEAVIVDGDLCGGREAERERKGSQKEV